eukprot:1142134-Pelagomonas_calceolata.AAC.2
MTGSLWCRRIGIPARGCHCGDRSKCSDAGGGADLARACIPAAQLQRILGHVYVCVCVYVCVSHALPRTLKPRVRIAHQSSQAVPATLQACGRERDCVELYRYMENNHPLPKFKKQAAQLRYIIEAPKLTLSKEEYVKVPQIQSDTWMQKKRKSKVPQMKRREPTEEELKKKKRAYWDRDWSMPGLEYIPDKWYVRVAWATTFIVFTVYANSKLM